MRAVAPTAQRFTILDWIGSIVAGVSSLGLFLFPVAGRTFASMFRDMGSRDLPALTRLVITWWFPVVLGLLVGAGVALGVTGKMPLQQRRMLVVGAFVFGAVAFAVCLIGVYLPVFALAGAIKAQ